MRENRIHRWLIAGAILVVAAIPAFASGFSIYEQDAKASAMAGAWTARADNAAANWYNPAAMVRQESSFQVGFNLVTIGGDSKFTSNDPALAGGLGVPLGTEFDPESNVATPVHLYYVQRVGERIAWGFGINTPFGLITEWTYPISIASKESELVTVVFNPNVAFALSDHWSIAVGVDYLFADLKSFSRDDGAGTTESNLSGDGGDWSFNFAVHYDSEDFKIGGSFRGSFSPEVEGSLEFMGASNASFDARADLNLPEQVAIGFAYTGAEKWELELDISWAHWSRFQELDIKVDGFSDIFVPENWDDTFAVRLGGSYDFGERHELRFGVLIDENPIPDETMRPSIPDSDRRSLTLGYGYQGSKIDLDFYYMALFFEDRTIAPVYSDLAGGVLAGDYENFSNLLGFTFGWRFGGGS